MTKEYLPYDARRACSDVVYGFIREPGEKQMGFVLPITREVGYFTPTAEQVKLIASVRLSIETRMGRCGRGFRR